MGFMKKANFFKVKTHIIRLTLYKMNVKNRNFKKSKVKMKTNRLTIKRNNINLKKFRKL